MTIEVDQFYEGALVETCIDSGIARPRVRAIHSAIPIDWRVEFPRDLRESNPIGTRFRCDLKVCQKHLKNGAPKGNPYLFAHPKSITLLAEFTPDRIIFAILNPHSTDRRSYSFLAVDSSCLPTLAAMRARAVSTATEVVTASRNVVQFSRSQLVQSYVHLRANGVCECCTTPAPFISMDGSPYLEVHHLIALSQGGDDSIFNTAAICPNCHSQITHGIEGQSLNGGLIIRIQNLEGVRS